MRNLPKRKAISKVLNSFYFILCSRCLDARKGLAHPDANFILDQIT